MRRTIRQSGRGDQELYFHQDSDQIVIRKSDLAIYFRDFKNAILSKPSTAGIILLISIWVPAFTADFKGILGLNSEASFGFYLAFVIVVSVFIIFQWLTGFFRPIINFFSLELSDYFPDIRDWLQRKETDPDLKVSEIRSKSLKK